MKSHHARTAAATASQANQDAPIGLQAKRRERVRQIGTRIKAIVFAAIGLEPEEANAPVARHQYPPVRLHHDAIDACAVTRLEVRRIEGGVEGAIGMETHETSPRFQELSTDEDFAVALQRQAADILHPTTRPIIREAHVGAAVGIEPNEPSAVRQRFAGVEASSEEQDLPIGLRDEGAGREVVAARELEAEVQRAVGKEPCQTAAGDAVDPIEPARNNHLAIRLNQQGIHRRREGVRFEAGQGSVGGEIEGEVERAGTVCTGSRLSAATALVTLPKKLVTTAV